LITLDSWIEIRCSQAVSLAMSCVVGTSERDFVKEECSSAVVSRSTRPAKLAVAQNLFDPTLRLTSLLCSMRPNSCPFLCV
jgi:hypothetical protein